jgi:hypothetical protein
MINRAMKSQEREEVAVVHIDVRNQFNISKFLLPFSRGRMIL